MTNLAPETPDSPVWYPNKEKETMHHHEGWCTRPSRWIQGEGGGLQTSSVWYFAARDLDTQTTHP